MKIKRLKDKNVMSVFFVLIWSVASYIVLYYTWYLNNISWWDTIAIDNTWNIITWNTEQPRLVISWDCSINNNEYDVLDIFWEWNTFKTQSVKNVDNYTRKVYISWYVEEVYVCVISDIRSDYKKYQAYAFSTYLYLWDSHNAWNINVWFNKERNLVYDSSSGLKRPWLEWRFRWNEAPYTQVVNLSSLTIWDTTKWWTKIISPIRLFNDWATIRLWWFTNSYPNRRAWEILKLRVIYKWWKIDLTTPL